MILRGGARALAALGRRSLSGYVIQSLAWVLLLSPYTLAMGDRTGAPALTAVVLAIVVWAGTVAAAAALERRSLPGPAEWLLRRVVYGNDRARGGSWLAVGRTSPDNLG
jgi:uncharacterized membrane protein YeiB